MPFIRRKIEPHDVGRQQSDSIDIFEEYDDVTNHALVGVLLQLSSVAFHAADVFREIEVEIQTIYRRCDDARGKLKNLYNRTSTLNPKDVPIPMSDLGTEEKIPLRFHYKSLNPVEKEFFTPNARSPCLVSLHQSASPDLSRTLQFHQSNNKTSTLQVTNRNDVICNASSTQGNTKNTKTYSSAFETSAQSRHFAASNTNLLPTPEEKVKRDCAQVKAEVIAVDTSGDQFDRRVSLRRLQRSSFSAVRRRSMLKYRSSRATMSFVESSGVADQLKSTRPSSVFSDTFSNSSFLARDVKVSLQVAKHAESPQNKQNVRVQTDPCEVATAAKRKSSEKILECRKISTASTVLTPPISEAHNQTTETVREPAEKSESVKLHNDREKLSNSSKPISSSDAERNVSKRSILLNSNASVQAEHRISSGFCSGSERHSTASEILLEHQHVAQALQQILSKPPHPTVEKTNNDAGDESDVSTLSINTQLSAIPHSSISSSFLSIDLPLRARSTSSHDSISVIASSSSDVATSASLSLSHERCSFSNPVYDYSPLPNSAFLTPAKSENQSRYNDWKSSNNQKLMINNLAKVNKESVDSGILSYSPQRKSLFRTHSTTPEKCSTKTPENGYFFGPDFQVHKNETIQKTANHDIEGSIDELQPKRPLQKQSAVTRQKPAPPRRTSSLKIKRDSPKNALPYMEPSNSNITFQRSSSFVTNEKRSQAISNHISPQPIVSSFKDNYQVSNKTVQSPTTTLFNSASSTATNSSIYCSAPAVSSPLIDSTIQSAHAGHVTRLGSSVSSSMCSSSDVLTSASHQSRQRASSASSASHSPNKPLRTKLLEIKTHEPTDQSMQSDLAEKTPEESALSVDESEGSSTCVSSVSTLEKEPQKISVASNKLSKISLSNDNIKINIKPPPISITESKVVPTQVKESTEEDQNAKLFMTSDIDSHRFSQNKKLLDMTFAKVANKQANQKPVIKPKPKSFSHLESNKNNSKKLLKKDKVIQRTASARAAFFGLPTATQDVKEHKQSPDHVNQTSLVNDKVEKGVSFKETDIDQISDLKKKTRFSIKRDITKNGTDTAFDSSPVQSQVGNQKKEEVGTLLTLIPASALEVKNDIPDGDIAFSDNYVINPEKENFEAQTAVPRLKSTSSTTVEDSLNKTIPNILTENQEENLAVVPPSSGPVISSSVASSSSTSSQVSSLVPDHSVSKNNLTLSTSETQSISSANYSSTQNFKSFLFKNRSKSSSTILMSATCNLRKQALQGSKLNRAEVSNVTSASERMVTASDLRAVLNASKYGRKVKSHSDRPKTFADISFTSAKNSSFSFGERKNQSRLQISSNQMKAINENDDKAANHYRRSTNVTEL